MSLDEFKNKLKQHLLDANNRTKDVLDRIRADPDSCFQESAAVLTAMKQTVQQLNSHEKLSHLQSLLDDTKSQRKASERELMALQEKHDRFLDRSDSKLRAYNSAIEEVQKNKQHYEDQISSIQDALAVKMGRSKSGSRVLALNCIDEGDPTRVFFITITRNEDHVTLKANPSLGDISDCQPSEDRPLPLCIQLLRERFVQLACRRRAQRQRLLLEKPSSQSQSHQQKLPPQSRGGEQQENREPNIPTHH